MVRLPPSVVVDLKRLARTDPDGQVRWRAQCLVVVAQSRTQQDAVRLVSVDPKTLARWRRRFVAEGRTGRVDRPRLGRPTKVPEEARQLLTRVLAKCWQRWGKRSLIPAAGVDQRSTLYGAVEYFSETLVGTMPSTPAPRACSPC